MKAKVQLPADQLIDYSHFCKMIAQAICPAREQKLIGIDCIVGKLVTHHVAKVASTYEEEKWPIIAGLQCVLLSEDGRTLDQLHMDQSDTAALATPLLPFSGDLHHDVVELTLPYKLTDEDRQQMENLLVDLPGLHYPISEEEVETFMCAYFDLPNRPAWEPILVTAETIGQRKVKQDVILQDHQKALQNELTHRRVVAVDSNHVPVARFGMGAFLPRNQAIAYLDRCGISHCDKPVSNHVTAEPQAPESLPETPKAEQSGVDKWKLTSKDRRDIVTLYLKLEGNGDRDFCKQVAEQYDVSDSYVRRLVRMARPEQDASRIVNAWVKPK